MIDIVTDGSLTKFGLVALANAHRLNRAWIVSPWLSSNEERHDPLQLIIEALRRKPCSVHILTRPPAEMWHKHAIDLVRARLKPVILFSPQLHAKLYILKCDGFQYALLGSPNLTPRADRVNRELAVEFRSTTSSRSDKVALMIEELIRYATALMSEEDAKLA